MRRIPLARNSFSTAAASGRTSSRRLISPTSVPSTASSSGVSAWRRSLSTQSDAVFGTFTFSARSSPGLPSSRVRPSAQVRMPRPTSTSHSSCGGMMMRRSSVERITASAKGWRECSSELAAYASTCSGCQSLCKAMIFVTTGRPTVSVPVLSNTIASTRLACSRCDPPLIRIPRRAPLPIAALIAVGVDRPTAHGHAISSIVIARRTSPVIARVIAETTKEIGTKRREKFSPTVWMGARSC